MINFFLAALASIVFGVSIKGSFRVLALCTLLYIIVTTGIGMIGSAARAGPGPHRERRSPRRAERTDPPPPTPSSSRCAIPAPSRACC
jgi:hypothetical protein